MYADRAAESAAMPDAKADLQRAADNSTVKAQVDKHTRA
jgi:hypothetical protein